MASIFEAAQTGDTVALRSLLDGDSQMDVNVKDENGNAVLTVAARNGHTEAVQELLSRGADRHEALAQGLGQTGSPVAALLNEYQHGSVTAQQAGEQAFGPIPTDIYGGYQLQDGSIAYGYPGYPPPFQGGMAQPAFYHDPVMFPHPHMQQPPYAYPPQNVNGAPRSRASPNMQNGHGRKPSAVGKFPPAEVAKTIPCRFYPNCRNGSSCIFAHIDSPTVAEGQSPSFAGAPSYPVYGPAAPPSLASFYSAGPYAPNAAPFYPAASMIGSPFNGQHRGPLPLHYQPHEASQPGQLTSEAPKPQDSSAPLQPPPQGDSQSSEAHQGVPPGAKNSSSGEQKRGAEPATSVAAEAETNEDSAKEVYVNDSNGQTEETSDTQLSAPVEGQERRRRQSFNSFLHSHAVPFQPSQMAATIQGAAVSIPLGPAATMNGIHGMPHHLGANGYAGMSHGYSGRGKLRGRGGVAGMGGRGGPRERTPCTFFAKDACKYGADCLYPHILPDGTDARYRSSSYIPSQHSEGVNGSSSSAKFNVSQAPSQPRRQGFYFNGVVSDQHKANGNGETMTANGDSFPSPSAASASLDAQAKKAAGLPPTPSAEVTGPSAYGIAVHSKASAQDTPVQSSTNGFVPSKPSATALADAAAASPTDTAATAAGLAESPAPMASLTVATPVPGPTLSQQKQQQTATQTQSHQRTPQHPSHQQRKNNVNKTNAASHSTAPAATVKKHSTTQRIPSGADFPALGGGASNGLSSQTSAAPAPQPPRKTPSTPSAGDGESSSTPSSTAVVNAPLPSSTTPKINFSAILSAPAPARKAATRESSSSAPNGGGSDGIVGTGHGSEDGNASSEIATESFESIHQQQVPDANGAANGHTKDLKTNKTRPLKGNAGSTSGGGKAWGSKSHSQTSQSSNATSKEPEVDEDDFVIVKRSHGKKVPSIAPTAASSGRNGSGNGNGNGAATTNFASVAKAAA